MRFCLENLAFLDYDRIDDLLQLLSSLEKIFAGTGSSVAQAIESEVLKLQVNGHEASDNITANGTFADATTSSQHADVQPEQLRQLASSAQILYSIWETRTFLVRLWNMQKHMVKTKQQAKDTSKAPNRATNAPTLTDAYLRRMQETFSSLDDEQAQHQMCRAFVELISVDSEVRVASDEDAEGDLLDGYGTPSEGSSRKSPSPSASGGGRGRKRKSVSTNSTPRKRGRPSLGKRKSTGKIIEDYDDDGGWD